MAITLQGLRRHQGSGPVIGRVQAGELHLLTTPHQQR